ncbi:MULTISPECIES: biotin-dependent carboxyltransferase family protein [unclassified Mycolicibacterium]|uniref:5-oxoprolinase subunit C family protein n=1 Tax=unclassified Mycolicibacterium TaxID=2636767 RepID=UPI002ED93847
MLTVTAPGVHTLIQDLGRPGHYAMGLPPSGALDQFSHRCANLLVGNHSGAATLEVTMVGPALLFGTPAHVAVTGGDVDVAIDGRPCQPWTSVEVAAGQTLRVGTLRSGCRAYIAIRGGVDSAPFLGSRSTYVSSAIGGLRGQPLSAGDVLPVGDLYGRRRYLGAGCTIEPRLRPTYTGEYTVRVIEGLCHYRFDANSVSTFFSSPYTVSSESDRTGYRLCGPALRFVHREPPFGAGDNPSNVVDLGYPMGSIQIPNGEEPICLLRDAVTGGGYATIGTVISTDLDIFGQLRAPDIVHFQPVSLERALQARRERTELLNAVETSLRLLALF